ncbi:tetratricopeptide repeat protein [Chryseotalea sanaruensis]|uniref:Tetratricopeptide repeat protein n=2 Tax=Chryseotalea sanaruensis TaxID=2482724 RepID=A0A401U903_9BACT|nr:tetratricopeptide repeat protein [Chryseotalea sanaruensis]
MLFIKRSKAIAFQSILKKASLMACLFCFYSNVAAQDILSIPQSKAHDLALNMQWTEARSLVKDNNAYSIYITSLCNTLELLINEDKRLVEPYELIFDKQLAYLDSQPVSAEVLFAQAELHLQLAFVYLKFEREFDGAFKLRKAYQLAARGRKKYPNFLPMLKSHGLLQILLGAVPEKYNWVLRMMNMEGSTQTGLAELQLLSNSNTFTNTEASIFLALIHGYVRQEPMIAKTYITQLIDENSSKDIISFVGATLALKNNNAEESLALLKTLTPDDLPAIDYLTGEALLYKGDYETAIKSFQQYIKHFKGNSFLKDAQFKTGICYQLQNNQTKAIEHYDLARAISHENTEADKYANRVLNSTDGINSKLTKIRFLTDGGYYDEARQAAQQISPSDIPSIKEQVEYYYRQGRLAHLSGKANAARLFYEQVIDMSGDPDTSEWYFAPNACLQLGYLKKQTDDTSAAKRYFTQAIAYKKHEYKNSIDAKAKAALSQLKTLK